MGSMKMSDSVGEGQLSYSISTMTKAKPYFMNLVKDLSWLNSRNFEHTTRDGHVKGYLVDIDIVCAEAVPFLFTTAPNTWKMRNSFRKFHAYRDMMFRKAGVTKREMGKYGRTIRPFLDPEQVSVTYPDPLLPQVPTVTEEDTLVPLGCTDAQREWTYTTLANEVQFSEGTIPGAAAGGHLEGVSDTWPLTICGENADSAHAGTNQLWSTVGMIHSYNLDRMEVVTPTAEEVIAGPANPLAALISTSAASGEVIDIAEDQELEAPPYDIRDKGDSIGRIIADYGNTNTATLQVIRMRNIFVPAGILTISQGTSGNLVQDVVILTTVKAIVDCKDWI